VKSKKGTAVLFCIETVVSCFFCIFNFFEFDFLVAFSRENPRARLIFSRTLLEKSPTFLGKSPSFLGKCPTFLEKAPTCFENPCTSRKQKIISEWFVSCDKFVTLQCAEKRYRRKHLSWQKKSTAAEKNDRRKHLSQQNASCGRK